MVFGLVALLASAFLLLLIFAFFSSSLFLKLGDIGLECGRLPASAGKASSPVAAQASWGGQDISGTRSGTTYLGQDIWYKIFRTRYLGQNIQEKYPGQTFRMKFRTNFCVLTQREGQKISGTNIGNKIRTLSYYPGKHVQQTIVMTMYRVFF